MILPLCRPPDGSPVDAVPLSLDYPEPDLYLQEQTRVLSCNAREEGFVLRGPSMSPLTSSDYKFVVAGGLNKS